MSAAPAEKPQNHEDYLAGLMTTKDILSVAYEMLVSGLNYEDGRTIARLPASTANEVVSILKAGRQLAEAELGEFAR